MSELFTVLAPGEAYRKLRAHLEPVTIKAERIAVKAALERVTAEDLYAPAPLPAFPRSAMDGYAVRAQDTYGATEGVPAYLKVAGEVAMGRPPAVHLAAGEAAKVHTGGMLADGADAVVIIEHTQAVDATTIEVMRPVAPGENVIQIGADVAAGARLLPKGHRLRPQDLGGLLALGIGEVAVAQKPRVALIATGDEIVPPEAEPGLGQVRDINTYTLSALVYQAGGLPVPMGIVPDNYQALQAAARRAFEEGDVLIISAGSSVSTRDMTAEAISSLGPPGILVHGVSLRPGKPTILAVVEGKPVFGLPGNPVSAMVTFDLFVAPTIHLLTGCINPPPQPTIQARLAHNIPSVPGREDYVRVRLEERNGVLWADPVFGQANLIFTLIKADGLVKVPLDAGGLAAGETVAVRLF